MVSGFPVTPEATRRLGLDAELCASTSGASDDTHTPRVIDAERLQALHKLMRVFALMTYDDWMACIDAATAGDEGMLRMIPLFAAATRHGRISELGRFMGGHERAYEATLCGTHVRPRLLLPHDGDDVPPTGTDD